MIEIILNIIGAILRGIWWLVQWYWYSFLSEPIVTTIFTIIVILAFIYGN